MTVEDRPRLNDEQSAALDAIIAWIQRPSLSPADNLFTFSGFAGTGKTFTLKSLVERLRGRLIFTAPTNKATKVLREMLTSPDYKPECRTIYSLLGLKMEANGEIKELAVPEDPVDLSRYAAVVIDEGSMINAQLFGIIREVAEQQNIRFLFVGDSAQLPPVKEQRSKIWDQVQGKAELTTIMRYDNELLKLATAIRKQIYSPVSSFKPVSDNNGDTGVFSLTQAEFFRQFQAYAESDDFLEPRKVKIIAWRNLTVDRYNEAVRRITFPLSYQTPWLVSDRVVVTELCKDESGEVIATTDEEGTVTRATEDWHPVWREFKIWRVHVMTDEGSPLILRVLHQDSRGAYAARNAEMLDAAKLDRRKWRGYWEFREAFHGLRHAYAITAHRAQGSTFDNVFVDWRDILANRTRVEAFQCLYVACTRASQRVYLG